MAQVTRAAHASSVATKLADNVAGDISAQDVREVITDLEDSAMWYDEGNAGDALVANPLSQFAATTSAQLAGVMSDETGSGALVFGTSPTLVTPALGTPSALVLTNATGLAEAQVTQHEAALTLTAGQVTAAGALMDSEVTNLAQVKAFDTSDYATSAQGSTADTALQDVSDDTNPALGGNLLLNGFGATFTATNNTGSNINLGDPVYRSGAGNIVSPADADGSGTMPVAGVAAETLTASGGTGAVVCYGFLGGLDTSAYSVNDPVYVSTTGTITGTPPTTGTIQEVARVVTVNASTGIIFIKPLLSGFPLNDNATLDDTSGNEVLQFGVTASAVNHVKMTNAATGNAATISAVGDDTNIDLTLSGKGTGSVAAGSDVDVGGNEIANYTNSVVTSVTGTLTVAAHSGNVLVTSGNVTVPTTAGFTATIIAGGAHTVTFNSTTSAAMATGDVMTLVVESGTVIHAVLTAAADKVSFT